MGIDAHASWVSKGYCPAIRPDSEGVLAPYCRHKAGHQQHEDPYGEAWTEETRPCPICGTNCSGCLEDLAAKQEGLRELLSYCRDPSRTNDLEAGPEANAYEDVAQKLASLLDGEA